jgi:hypothetical protein
MAAAMTLIESNTGEIVFEGHRVTYRSLCPVCHHNTWCLTDVTRGLTICPRIESPKKIGSAGWMHSSGGELPHAQAFTRPVDEVAALEGADQMQSQFVQQGAPRLGLIAMALGLSLESLERLNTGWNGSAWTFPMRNHRHEIVGFRTRTESGQKFAIKGSRAGLFIPQGVRRQRGGVVWVVEGPSDCAAMLDMGVDAIGRPSCRGSEQEISRWAAGMAVMVLADNDTPGVDGAVALMQCLRRTALSVEILLPPHGLKDARMVLNHGGTKSDFMPMRVDSNERRSTHGPQA